MTASSPMMAILGCRPLRLAPGHPEALLTEDELRKCLEHTILSLSELQSSVLVLRERQGLNWKKSVIS